MKSSDRWKNHLPDLGSPFLQDTNVKRKALNTSSLVKLDD
jgi:hypothetical protein